MASDSLSFISSRTVSFYSKKFFRLFRITNRLRRVFTVLMIAILLSNPVAAATIETTPIAISFAQDMRFAFYSSGWAKFFGMQLTSITSQGKWDGKGAPRRNRPAATRAEKHEEREAKVARIKIYPGDITIQADEMVVFNAVAEDGDGNTVGGAKAEWSVLQSEKNNLVSLSSTGQFKSSVAGTYVVTANIAGVSQQIKVTVIGEASNPNEKEAKKIHLDSRELRKKAQLSKHAPLSGTTKGLIAGNHRKQYRASASNMMRASGRMKYLPEQVVPITDDPTGWNGQDMSTFSDVGKERGNIPGRAYNAGVGSGNFQLTAPAVSLSGRGIDVNLSFNYNSRLWHKSGSSMYFDIDRDWIPGWNIGFGKIVGTSSGFLMIDGDATRHEFSGDATVYSNNSVYIGHTTDGTFIDYIVYSHNKGYEPNPDKTIINATAWLPNGTRIDYGAAGNYSVYPTQITDAHGNFISITYQNNSGPNIQSITDTLGRTIKFYYDSSNYLTAITAPGFQGGAERQLVRLVYRNLYLANAGTNFGFQSGLTTVVRDTNIKALVAIYYPATSTGYWFDDVGGYSPYGMIRKYSERRGMTFSGGVNEQGSLGAGSVAREIVYSNPNTPGYSDLSGSLDDTPLYTQMTEDWAFRQDSIAVTQFSSQDNGTTSTNTVIRGDGIRNDQITDSSSASSAYGLMQQNITYSPSGVQLHQTKTHFVTGAYGSQRPDYVYQYDDKDQMTSTNFVYGDQFNAPTLISEYGYTGQLLKQTKIQYLNNVNYNGIFRNDNWQPGVHIYNIPSIVEVYAGDGLTRVSRSEYQYDQNALIDAPSVPQYTTPQNQYRGDVTKTITYADAVNLDPNSAVVANFTYDMTGNTRIQSTACCEQTSLNYTSNTGYAWPESMKRGSASDAALQNTSSAVYDFNTGVVLESYDANGRRSNTVYDTNSLRPLYEYLPTGAYIFHGYGDAGLWHAYATYEAGKWGENYSSRGDVQFDGKSQTLFQASYGQNNVRHRVEFFHDMFGRVTKQSQPFVEGTSTQQWTTTEYDVMSRPIKITSPDGSNVQRFYNELSAPSAASSNAGQTVRSQDAWGRERWGRFDEQNRLVEVVEPNPSGNGSVVSDGMSTHYTYDSLGNLTGTNQGGQTRTFKYDPLARLTHQKLAERDATLNDNGDWVSNGNWSDVFRYDTRSNLTMRVDARGVRMHFQYENDPLNRLHGTQQEKSGAPSQLADNIPNQYGVSYPSINVVYDYATTGDKTRVVGIRRDGGNGNQVIEYDVESRVSQVTQTFSGREAYPLVTNYLWDTLSRIKEVRYPQKYGAGDARKINYHTYDTASNLTELKYGDVSMMSNPVLNSSNQITSLAVGDKITEKYDFDPKTGLLIGQQVNKGTEKLVDLKYNYTLNNDLNNSGAKTGQLTSVTDLKNHDRNRGYSYDRLGRLSQVQGGTNAFNYPDWNQIYHYDRYGNKSAITKTGGEPDPSNPTEKKWIDDSIPGGANTNQDGGDGWNWIGGEPQPKSGAFSHVSNIASGYHQHYFDQATERLMINTGDKLYAWVYIDPANVPEEIMLQWSEDSAGWAHRAYWGANKISLGVDGTNSRRYMGPLPQAGGWVKLEVAALSLGLEGKTLKGMSFTLYGGRVWWDKAGKVTSGVFGSIPTDGMTTQNVNPFSYNSTNNRITSPGFEYDPAGNQTSAQINSQGTIQKYKYDAANRLAQVLDANGAVLAEYAYGNGNERIMSIESGVTTYYAREGGQVIAEYEAAGASGMQWKMSYIYMGGRLLATEQSNGIRYHHPDRLGSRLVTDGVDGSVVTENLHLPFGTPMPMGATLGGDNSWQDPAKSNLSKKKFTSYDKSDTTGLDYAMNRHYSSSQGRFTQVDPIGMVSVNLMNPQTLNLYAYCANDPVNYLDPTGLLIYSMCFWSVETWSGWDGDTYVVNRERLVFEGCITMDIGISDSNGSSEGDDGGDQDPPAPPPLSPPKRPGCGDNPITGKSNFNRSATSGEVGHQSKGTSGQPYFNSNRSITRTDKDGKKYTEIYKHGALDIAADPGVSSVYPLHDGTVLRAGVGSGRSGNRVEIEHDNGVVSVYMHLDSFSVKDGDKVSAGEAFAVAGNSGRPADVADPHLHFMIKINDAKVDPENYLNSPCPQ